MTFRRWVTITMDEQGVNRTEYGRSEEQQPDGRWLPVAEPQAVYAGEGDGWS